MVLALPSHLTSILIKLYTLCSVFKTESCFHSLFLIKFSWRWNLNNFNRPKNFTSVFHLTLITTCFLGLIWTWLFSNLYTSTSFNVSSVNIRFLYFSLHSGPGYVSASESITRRKSPRASFPHLRYCNGPGVLYFSAQKARDWIKIPSIKDATCQDKMATKIESPSGRQGKQPWQIASIKQRRGTC